MSSWAELLRRPVIAICGAIAVGWLGIACFGDGDGEPTDGAQQQQLSALQRERECNRNSMRHLLALLKRIRSNERIGVDRRDRHHLCDAMYQLLCEWGENSQVWKTIDDEWNVQLRRHHLDQVYTDVETLVALLQCCGKNDRAVVRTLALAQNVRAQAVAQHQQQRRQRQQQQQQQQRRQRQQQQQQREAAEAEKQRQQQELAEAVRLFVENLDCHLR
jgi:hypothetical protein